MAALREPDRALTRIFPAFRRVPRLALGTFPTPVEPIDLSAAVPAFAGSAWVKREDESAVDIGGNKVRKLEFLLGEALDRGASDVVTTGGIGSNHCLVTAFYAADADLDANLVVFPHAVTPTSRRTLAAIAALGPRMTFCPVGTLSPAVAAAVHARLAASGRSPYLVPPGGASVTGTLGWVDAGVELAEQIHSGELEEPDAVFLPYASGGSAAGLALGLQLGGVSSSVVAVRVYDLPATTGLWVRSLAQRTAARVGKVAGEDVRFDGSAITVLGDYLGARYAEPTEAGSAAREVAAQLGFAVDPTYSAKAFAAFLDAAGSAFSDKRLLFVLTYDGSLPGELTEDDPTHLLPRQLRKYL